MGDAIREQSDDDKDPREEFLLEYQEETPLEIQDIQLEAGMRQHSAEKNLCKHTQDAQNAQHPLIIDSGAHCSIVARNYMDNHITNWERMLLPTKAKNFKSASGNMNFIGTITNEIIIPHRKGNIRVNPESVVPNDAHIQGCLLGTDYQRMYGIDIYIIKKHAHYHWYQQGKEIFT
ncbi:hypothetical protein O181_005793 [Austropuccinia psidii MF-1]|uniref:Uncharacterized protein n=1 Tax=Austropuccinia psidii MF-1 TaxID=1389203 RepID=A0A9Q3BJ72_9BASI|nr:hypothetical protein [Austropuccinia psidii MF-1]